MITDPDRYIEAFAEAGAAMMSVHVEVLPHLHRTVHAIKALGAKAGVVLNPSTPVAALEEIAGDVDFVLVMSVNPGFGGQTLHSRAASARSREVRALLDRAGNRAPVEIDGGIDLENVGRVVAAGARDHRRRIGGVPVGRSRARHSRAEGGRAARPLPVTAPAKGAR